MSKPKELKPWESGTTQEPWDVYGEWLGWMDEKMSRLEHCKVAWDELDESVKPHIYGAMCEANTRPGTNKFKPDYPASIPEAIDMLREMRDEPGVLSAAKTGLQVGINALETIRDNQPDSSKAVIDGNVWLNTSITRESNVGFLSLKLDSDKIIAALIVENKALKKELCGTCPFLEVDKEMINRYIDKCKVLEAENTALVDQVTELKDILEYANENSYPGLAVKESALLNRIYTQTAKILKKYKKGR